MPIRSSPDAGCSVCTSKQTYMCFCLYNVMTVVRLRAPAAPRMKDVGKSGRSGGAHAMHALRYSGAVRNK